MTVTISLLIFLKPWYLAVIILSTFSKHRKHRVCQLLPYTYIWLYNEASFLNQYLCIRPMKGFFAFIYYAAFSERCYCRLWPGPDSNTWDKLIWIYFGEFKPAFTINGPFISIMFNPRSQCRFSCRKIIAVRHYRLRLGSRSTYSGKLEYWGRSTPLGSLAEEVYYTRRNWRARLWVCTWTWYAGNFLAVYGCIARNVTMSLKAIREKPGTRKPHGALLISLSNKIAVCHFSHRRNTSLTRIERHMISLYSSPRHSHYTVDVAVH